MTFLRSSLLIVFTLLSPPAAQAQSYENSLPSLGDSGSALVSPRQEYLLGRAWLGMLRHQVKLIPDPLIKDYVENSIYKLAETSQVQDRRFAIVVLDTPELNAFSVPGGVFGVNGGLILQADNEGEYASVLTHELAHLSQRHFARGLETQQQLRTPMLAALLAGIVAAAAGAGDAGMAAIAASQAGAIQKLLSFSRQNEQEADRIGMQNLQRAGYDPRTMPQMFEKLGQQYRYENTPPEFLLTHPITESRVADTRNRAEQYPKGGRIDTLRYQLMRARAQLRFEDTPGMALKRFRQQLSDDPNSDAARYGLALALTKADQYDEADTTLQPLLKKAPDDIVYNLAKVDLDMETKGYTDAQQRLDRLLKLYPSSYPLQQARVDLLRKQNRIADAGKIIEQLLKRRPIDPDIWFQASEVRGQNGNIIGVYQAKAEYFALTGDYDQAIKQLDYAKRRASDNFPLAATIDTRQKALIAEKEAVKELMN